MKKLLLIVAAIYLVGCAATGVEVKEESLADLKKGETTIQEVVAKIGNPTTSTLNMDGSRTIMYVYASSTTRPETFIPYVGAFVGGADTKSNVVSLMFDKDGVLQNYTSSASNYGTGMGFAAGTKVDQERTSQPQQAK